MRYRTLGRTGLEVSEIGLGGAVFAGTSHGPFNETDAIAAVHTALETGVNYIDTSRHYGPSEEIIGKALTGYTGDCIICTKLAPRPGMTAAGAISGVEESLGTLRRPYVDVLLAHDIQQVGEGANAVETILQPGGMVDGFRQLQREGRARFIGVSGRLVEVTAAVQTGEFDVALTFNRFNLLDWSAEAGLLPQAESSQCRRNGGRCVLSRLPLTPTGTGATASRKGAIMAVGLDGYTAAVRAGSACEVAQVCGR